MTSENLDKSKWETIFTSNISKMKSGGMSIRIESGDKACIWEQSNGDLEGDKQFMIASVSKLFATTVLLNLVQEGKLSLTDSIAKYLPEKTIRGLNVYKGNEYSNQITVEMLMTQTSGLPDYYSEKCKDGLSGEQMLKKDRELSLEERIERTKELKSKYEPGKGKKSYYSDINWDIFQPIIESLSKKSIAECYEQYIIKPLQLTNTYLFIKGMDFSFPGIYIKDGIYKMPKLLAEWPLSGAVVSNNHDMICFLRAFWQGQLFSKELFDKYNYYKYIIFPMEYGLGNVRFRYPGVPDLYGHSGATGVVCYYAPEYDIYISACINELNEIKATRMLAKYMHDIKKQMKQ